MGPGLILAAAAGCGGAPQGTGAPVRPSPDQTLNQLFNLQGVYQRIGRLATGAAPPFVGNVSVVAGPGDSVIALLGLSLQNRALVFQRSEPGFIARYRVDVALQVTPSAGEDSARFAATGTPAPITMGREEVVRVPSFNETLRTDESIIFRQSFMVLPGTYKVTVQVKDMVGGATSRAEGTFTAPAYGAGSLSEPILAYQATPRTALSQPLDLIPNPRGVLVYGGDSLRIYLEGYRLPGPVTVPLDVRDERDSVIIRDSVRFSGQRPVEGMVLRLSPSAIPLGIARLSVGAGAQARSTGILVSFAQGWLLTNYGEMVTLLRYFPNQTLVDSLRKAPESERPRLWREFWAATDPNPATPENEALDVYFARLAAANARFRDEGVPGWRTDRGEVFIQLGDPDEVYDAGSSTQRRYLRWVYNDYRLSLTFVDETGFGRFRLTPASRSEFERVAARLRSTS
ncbi:MAG: GWxTD domain-containing protein [Gemmatimonadota bacterium]